jgi:hypothetical protein
MPDGADPRRLLSNEVEEYHHHQTPSTDGEIFLLIKHYEAIQEPDKATR